MFITYDGKAISVYIKLGSIFKVRMRYIRFDVIKAIYIIEDDYGLSLELFLFNEKRIILSNSLDRTIFYIENWDDLIRALLGKYQNFNMNNCELLESFKPKLLYDIPIICWHSEREVADLTVIETQGGPLVIWEESDEDYTASGYYDSLGNSRLLEKLAIFSRRIRSKYREYYFAEIDDETILVYSKKRNISRKVVHKINFDSLKAIFADVGCVQQAENNSWEPSHMHLKFLLNGDTLIDLRQGICEDDNLSIVNWDELIESIANMLPSFNMSNYDLAYKAYSPILCWHAERQVPNLTTVINQKK